MKGLNLDMKLISNFISDVKKKFPLKSFGYFLSSSVAGEVDDYIVFQNDIRNEMKEDFEAYGNYYIRNNDAGFLATPEETFKIHKQLKDKKKYIVGVFHSHQRHPAIFSKVDINLHPSEDLWHLIISLRNFDIPEIKAFIVQSTIPKELKINYINKE